MIKNPELVTKLEENLLKDRGRLNLKQSFKIYDSLWQEAIHLRIFPLKDPLEGIEKDIKLARILNSCSKKS